LSATHLGALAIKAAVERSGLTADAVEYVIMGHVVTAGTGQNPSRIAAAAAGIPMSTPAVTVNKVCLSGIDAIVLADQLIRAGEYDVIVAGGMESMSQAPHLLPPDVAYGDILVHDSLERDGLWDYFTNQAMGALTDQMDKGDGGTRAEQEAFAAASHHKAARAWKEGLFADEVIPVTVPQRRGEPLTVTADEGIRPNASTAALAQLKPSFAPNGTITAGTSSPLSDGAAATVITSRRYAEHHGLRWIAAIDAHATVAGPDSSLQHQPANAIEAACGKAGMTPADLDLVEINEAFAAVGLASTRQLGVNPDSVNIDGGAIAVGHPLGMSGTRITLHLALSLGRRGGGVGAAALCGGGGQGQALVISAPSR
jgi:acetyl-CoA C-acetyltransferase